MERYSGPWTSASSCGRSSTPDRCRSRAERRVRRVRALARLHPGRFHAGVGHGVEDWMRQVGAKPASQLQMLRETVEAVRGLLGGETVSVEGRYVRLRGVTLDRPPTTVPPVSVGVRGPKSLELAGQVADGTVIDWLSSAAYVRWARERIDAGRAVAGRTNAHRLTVYACIANDAAAEGAVRRAIGERRARGGAQSAFLDAPLSDLAVAGDAAARKRALRASRTRAPTAWCWSARTRSCRLILPLSRPCWGERHAGAAEAGISAGCGAGRVMRTWLPNGSRSAQSMP